MLNAYIFFAKLKFKTTINYRFEIIASILSSMITMLSMIFLWKAVYHALNTVDGLSEKQMITYSVLSALLGLIFSCNVENVLYDRILQGDIAVDFMRPTNLILCYLFEDIGTAVSSFLIKFIPIFCLVAFFFFIPKPYSTLAALLFIMSTVLSFIILWFMSAIVGILNFKLIELGNIAYIKSVIIALLSGSIIPLWFLPERVKAVLRFFPFQYTYQTTIGIFIGKYSLHDAIMALYIQGIWIFVLFLLLYLVWNHAQNHVLIQGG